MGWADNFNSVLNGDKVGQISSTLDFSFVSFSMLKTKLSLIFHFANSFIIKSNFHIKDYQEVKKCWKFKFIWESPVV